MPSTSESRIIAAAQADVWTAIADLGQASRWNEAWQRVEYLSEGHEGPGVTFRAHTEDGKAFDFRVSEWSRPEYVAFEPIRAENERRYLITLDSHSFRLRPAGDGHTNVILIASATGNGIRGWIFARVLWPSYQRQGLRRALDALQNIFEPPEQTEAEQGDDA